MLQRLRVSYCFVLRVSLYYYRFFFLLGFYDLKTKILEQTTGAGEKSTAVEKKVKHRGARLPTNQRSESSCESLFLTLLLLTRVSLSSEKKADTSASVFPQLKRVYIMYIMVRCDYSFGVCTV